MTPSRVPLLLASFAAVLLLASSACKSLPPQAASKSSTTKPATVNTGLRTPTPAEIREALHLDCATPQLVEFKTRFCLDCQKLAPILSKVTSQFPSVHVSLLDVQADRDSHKALFKAFQPVTVPVVILISPSGEIHQVLSGVPTEATLRQAMTSLIQRKPTPGVCKAG